MCAWGKKNDTAEDYDTIARRKIMNKSAKLGIKLNDDDASNFLDFVRSSVQVT